MSNIESVWTVERVSQLTSLWERGLSASRIGDELGVTRNAVIGKAHRINLPERKPRIASDPIAVIMRRREYMRQYNETRYRAVRQARREQEQSAWSAIKAADIPTTPHPCALLQLEPHHCRWPHGDPRHANFFFCGADIVEGFPYCAAHIRKAYIASPR